MAIVALMTFTASASAMSYEQARREALFLTDKMAYELNLTDDQYEAAYEINLDYLMGVTSVDDVYGTYWSRRNLDISYILLDWQWRAFCSASYFYRPLYWSAGCWHFGVYARYPHRHYFYFHHPTVYVSYRGGHSWRSNGGHSYYHGRQDHFRSHANHVGLRDRWDRGEIDRRSNHALPNNRNDRNPAGNRFDRNNSSNRFDRNNSSNRFDRNNSSNRFDRNNSRNRFDRNVQNDHNGLFGRKERGNGTDRNSSTRVTVRQREESTMDFNRQHSGTRDFNRQSNGTRNFNRQSESRSFNRQSESRSFSQPKSFSQPRSFGNGSKGGGSFNRGGSGIRQSGGGHKMETKRM